MEYHLNLDKVLKSPDIPIFIKSLIETLQGKGNVTVGSWIKNSSTLDLIAATTAASQLLSNEPPNFSANRFNLAPSLGKYPLSVPSSFMLLADILTTAEGIDLTLHENPDDPRTDDTIGRLSLLDTFITMELLRRKGFDVKIHHDNMSLSTDSKDPSLDSKIMEAGPTLNEQLKLTKGPLADKLAGMGTIPVTPTSTRTDKGTVLFSNFEKISVKSVPQSRISEIMDEEMSKAFRSIQLRIDEEEKKIGSKGSDLDNKFESLDEFGSKFEVNQPFSMTFKGRIRDTYNAIVSWIKSFRKAKIQGKSEQ